MHYFPVDALAGERRLAFGSLIVNIKKQVPVERKAKVGTHQMLLRLRFAVAVVNICIAVVQFPVYLSVQKALVQVHPGDIAV